jgi:hypothetical protein
MITVYFQPPGINKKYCEVGFILDSDPNYIHFKDQPCKVLISDVKIIPNENVTRDKRSGLYCLINQINVVDAQIVANKKIN